MCDFFRLRVLRCLSMSLWLLLLTFSLFLCAPLSCCFCPLILTPSAISSSCASFPHNYVMHLLLADQRLLVNNASHSVTHYYTHAPTQTPTYTSMITARKCRDFAKSCAPEHIHLKRQVPENFQLSKFYGCTSCRSTHKNTLTLILRESRRCLGTWWSILNAASCHSQDLIYSTGKPFQSHFVVVTNINLGVIVSVQHHL